MYRLSGLSVGLMLPRGRKSVESSGIICRGGNTSFVAYSPEHSFIVYGIINSLIAFVLGIIGYQRSRRIQFLHGIIFLTTLFWMQASFLLWFIVFKRARVDLPAVLIVACLLITAVAKASWRKPRKLCSCS